jgi:hypothetical protein
MKPSGLLIKILFLSVLLLLLSIPGLAHHGTAISYDMSKKLTLKAVVTEFKYANPHPSIFFDYTNDKGEVEHWVSEMLTNVSFLMRAGWTKKRSEEALKPGTTVVLTVYRSKAGGLSGVVTKIETEAGEQIVAGSPADRDAIIDKEK